MNKIIYYASALTLLISSCTNEDYQKYDTSIKDGVYIEHYKTNVSSTGSETKELIDSTFFNFGFSDITEYTYNIRCAIMGQPSDNDRTVSVKSNNSKFADDEFLAAKESYFELPSSVIIPKGAVEATIPVKLKRHEELASTRAIVTVELVANENFDIKGSSIFNITFDDKTPPTPAWWATYSYGAFTKFKGQLFFKYFWEMEQENEYIYDKIISRWGRNLDIPPYIYANNPLNVYPFAFASIVQQKMWEYSTAHPELNLNISKPNLY